MRQIHLFFPEVFRAGFIGGVPLCGFEPTASLIQSCPEPWEYVDDIMINSKVETCLTACRVATAWTTAAKTVRGVVRLTGTVETLLHSRMAERIAAGVVGVRAVVNELEIR